MEEEEVLLSRCSGFDDEHESKNQLKDVVNNDEVRYYLFIYMMRTN